MINDSSGAKQMTEWKMEEDTEKSVFLFTLVFFGGGQTSLVGREVRFGGFWHVQAFKKSSVW